METLVLSSHTLVADLLSLAPQTMPFFIELRLDCIGCAINKFCTLGEVADHYALDLEDFLAHLQQRLDPAKRSC